MNGHTETIEDAALQAQLRRQARKVYAESIAAGVVLTLLLLIAPI